MFLPACIYAYIHIKNGGVKWLTILLNYAKMLVNLIKNDDEKVANKKFLFREMAGGASQKKQFANVVSELERRTQNR